jgi:hypothetical protein
MLPASEVERMGQLKHAALPDVFLYFPVTHEEHTPLEPTYPASQSHPSILDPAKYDFEYRGQLAHAVCPATEYLPVAHSVHDVCAPVEYVPAAHAVQFQPSAPYKPALHVQVSRAELEFAGHALQPATRLTALQVP